MLTTFIRKKKWRFIPKWLHPIFYMLFLSLDQLRRATKLQWLQGESNPQRHLRPGRMYLTLDLNSVAIRLILQIGVSGGWGDYRNKADSILFSFGKRKPPAYIKLRQSQHKHIFRRSILAKLINAEQACYKSRCSINICLQTALVCWLHTLSTILLMPIFILLGSF